VIIGFVVTATVVVKVDKVSIVRKERVQSVIDETWGKRIVGHCVA
jgi:hypothetical protein